MGGADSDMLEKDGPCKLLLCLFFYTADEVKMPVESPEQDLLGVSSGAIPKCTTPNNFSVVLWRQLWPGGRMSKLIPLLLGTVPSRDRELKKENHQK